MLEQRGKWYLEDEPQYSYSEEDLRRAQERMTQTIMAHDAEIAAAAANQPPQP